MSVNISKQKRDILIKKIKELKDFISSCPQNQNTQNLLGYIGDILKEIDHKKYGLVFEEHQEGIDITLSKSLPILSEEKDLAISNDGELNFLLEGDNLAALQLLEKTHKGKIDIIYIDPPYNTGNKDFIYDDSYVDSTDEFKHSKWISFMKKRLNIAKNLLSSNGFIFLSIDDNEQADLKILCDEVFGEYNFIANLVWRKKYGGGKGTRFAVDLHEYILCYSKDNSKAQEFLYDRPEEKSEVFNLEDDFLEERGRHYIRPLKSGLAERKTLVYPILCPDGSIIETQWICAKDTFDQLNKEGRIVFVKNTKTKKYNVYKKFYEKDNGGKIHPDSILYDIAYNQNGKETIKKIFNISEGRDVPFSNAKPVELIVYLLKFCNPKGDYTETILDFFAGSGTTGHAVLKLNAEDGGHRRFILCTNNENNICRDITYQRLKTVITGKRKDGSTYSDGLPGSLKYFKVNYLPVEEKMYYEYADELLSCIKELVELENGTDLATAKSVSIIMSDEELEEYINNIDQHPGARTLYISHDVLASSQQEQTLQSKEIAVRTIPEYYYPDTETRGSNDY